MPAINCPPAIVQFAAQERVQHARDPEEHTFSGGSSSESVGLKSNAANIYLVFKPHACAGEHRSPRSRTPDLGKKGSRREPAIGIEPVPSCKHHTIACHPPENHRSY